MAADAVKRTHVGLCGPSSIPLGTQHNADPSLHVNQLQFNLQAPYSINSLASNFQTPQPLLIEKLSVFPNKRPEVRLRSSIPTSLASSVSSERLHFAVQLAKIDAKKLWREQKQSTGPEHNLREVELNEKQTLKATEVKGTRRMIQDKKRPNVGYVQYKHKKDGDVKRKLRDCQLFPEEDNEADKKPSVGSVEKQTREIRGLEKQIQNYLQRLDDLIHKGHEVVQKKDKRLHVRRNDKDDMSHLSDEDTDPRQYQRAEEQATRSARVLYMIERQIRELDDEIRKKGKNMKQSKKSETLGRLAAAQRATVRALRMLINSAPLQPKRSQHYPSMYQALTSLIQQLSLLSIQIEDGDVELSRKAQDARFDDPLKKRSEPNRVTQRTRFGLSKTEAKFCGKNAFFQEPERDVHELPYTRETHPTYRSFIQGTCPDDSTLTVDPTPERNATLKAGLEALLRAKELQRISAKPPTIPNQANTKKKAVLLPSALQAKRRKAHIAVQKSVRFPSDTAHFTRETTASRLKKVERQKYQRKTEASAVLAAGPGEAETRIGAERREPETRTGTESRDAETRTGHEIDHRVHEREIERQLWLEEQSRKKLQEVMDIPKSLVTQAEDAIKKKLRPLLDQAQAVIDSSKAKPVQERFANIASRVTIKENEVLSEMILDDLLLDTAREFQSLERNEEIDDESSFVQDSSTLENILQRLEHFEEEEQSIRRNLNHISYEDIHETKQGRVRNTTQNYKDDRENSPTKDSIESMMAVRPSSVNYTRASTVFNPVDKHPVSLFLPSKVQDNIFSYREKYSEYLKQTNAGHHGTFDPWKLVERLSDEILEGIISEVASEFTGACDDVTEMLFKSEFMKE